MPSPKYSHLKPDSPEFARLLEVEAALEAMRSTYLAYVSLDREREELYRRAPRAAGRVPNFSGFNLVIGRLYNEGWENAEGMATHVPNAVCKQCGDSAIYYFPLQKEVLHFGKAKIVHKQADACVTCLNEELMEKVKDKLPAQRRPETQAMREFKALSKEKQEELLGKAGMR
jgi:hypothetical protein